MHLSLIALLGPWGLDHSLGVLVWNALLIVQAWVLFVRPRVDSRDETRQPSQATMPSQSRARGINIASALTYVVVAIAMVAPLFERSGYWDHWLSWRSIRRTTAASMSKSIDRRLLRSNPKCERFWCQIRIKTVGKNSRSASGRSRRSVCRYIRKRGTNSA